MNYEEREEFLKNVTEDLKYKKIFKFNGINNSFYVNVYENRNEHYYDYLVSVRDDKTFSIDVLKDGFFIENPDSRKLFENYNFSKEELVSFMKEFPRADELMHDRNLISADDFIKMVDNDKLILNGINKTYQIPLTETYSNDVGNVDIAYFTDKNNNHYRVQLSTNNCLCPSGIMDASLGEIEFGEVDDLPTEFTYIPKGDYILLNNTYESFDLDVGNGEILKCFLDCDEVGSDVLYPDGRALIFIREDDIYKFFDKGTYIVLEEDEISLNTIDSKENENINDLDDDFDYNFNFE